MSDDEEVLAFATRRVGTVLHGKYHLDRVIGVGGMATVYAATHRNRKRFAVKMLHPEFSVRRDVRTRFVREGYVANSVNHPGVVTVLDDDVDETGAAFLVMELLEGVSVEALYGPARTPVPLREALAISHKLLDVLEAAHERTVVHRDVKPANLFVLTDGRVKVLDFGIARLREADAGLKSTRTGAMLGTPAFMAPEQALAVPGEIDERTDIWGAGATLFTMLTARYVHEGENARQIMIRAATEPARSLALLAPDLPASVIEIVSRALMFDKSARWPSAASMRDAVVEAHRQLFGEPARHHLSELVERASEAIARSPTEVSPGGDPGELDPTRVTGRGGPPDIDASLLPASRAVVNTVSTPVSTGSARGNEATRWRRLGVVSVIGALVAAGLFLLLSRGPAEPRLAAPAEKSRARVDATVSPVPAPTPPVESGRALATSAPSSSTDPQPSAAEPRSRATTSTTSARGRGQVVPAAMPAEPANASSAAPRPNPLQLNLL